MNEMYFSVPYGTREMSFGVADDEGGELWNFYLIFIESATMNLRQVIVYGDYKEDGVNEMQTLSCERHDRIDNEFEFEFDISEMKKVNICLFMSEHQYTIQVKY